MASARASVQRKLLAAFLLITLLFAMGAFSVYTVRSMSRQSELLDKRISASNGRSNPPLAGDADAPHRHGASGARGSGARPHPAREQPFSEALARLEQAVRLERAVIQKIRSGQEEAMITVADIANLVRDGKFDAARTLHSGREDPLYRSIDALAYELVERENARMVALRSSIQAANQRSLVVLGSFAAVSVDARPRGRLHHLLGAHHPRPLRARLQRAGKRTVGEATVENRDEFGELAAQLTATSKELARLDAVQRAPRRSSAPSTSGWNRRARQSPNSSPT